MKRLSIVALVIAGSGWAEPTDYFPLQVGNRWVLQTASATPELLNIEVLRSRLVNDATYFLVSGYAVGDRWLRKSADATVFVLDEISGKEEVVARVGTGGPKYQTSLGGCEQWAQPFGQAGPYHGPYLDAPDPLTVQYWPDACRDVGIDREMYAPGIGLVHRSIETIRGEITFDLVYARVSGSAVLGKAKEIVLKDDFNSGSKGWLPGFSDYSLRTSDLRMLAELRALPQEISQPGSGFYIQSMNRSDDLFMFLKKQVSMEDGLEPNQNYLLSFDIQFASNAATSCVGAGGSSGDSVYLKAGASADEPVASIDGAGDIRLLIDKGQQSAGGRVAGVAGTIANGTSCDASASPYVSVRRDYAHPYSVRTDDRGSLWLLTGTDSAYEGFTGLYFQSITVRINPAGESAKGR